MISKYTAADALPSTFSSYVEPFMGGGAMFIWAHDKNPKADLIINDLNAGIMSIYTAIKNDVQVFTEHLDKMSAEYLPLEKGEANKALEKELEKDWKQLHDLNPCRQGFKSCSCFQSFSSSFSSALFASPFSKGRYSADILSRCSVNT